MFGESTIFERLAEKVWRMNKSAKGLSMVGINLDGFSLANRLLLSMVLVTRWLYEEQDIEKPLIYAIA